MLRKLFQALILMVIIVLGAIVTKTILFKSIQIQVAALEPIVVADSSIVRFQQAIAIPTISYDDSALFKPEPFIAFRQLLQASYPLIESQLQKELINGNSLLYTWKGKDTTAKPILLLAHMDVVPVEEVSNDKWTQPPFSGANVDGFIWGRGSMDDKLSVIGIMEAVEHLLQKHYQPRQTIYLAFGHDEEISGRKGAVQIAALLKQRGVKAELVLDEGMAITQGLVPGITKQVALIGIAEKGFASVKLHCHIAGGHSSMPERETNIGLLSTAIAKLQANPFPTQVTPATQAFINAVGPEMPITFKLLFANMWLFKPIFVQQMTKTASGSATLRTTTAPTIFKSGIKENVIPTDAEATLNFRILPGETPTTVIERAKGVISDDRIEATLGEWNQNPSPISSTTSTAYVTIATTIKQLWPDAIIAPSLVLGATDSRNYIDAADNIYRFQPIPLKDEDLSRLHGINERVAVNDFKKAVAFYYQFIVNATSIK